MVGFFFTIVPIKFSRYDSALCANCPKRILERSYFLFIFFLFKKFVFLSCKIDTFSFSNEYESCEQTGYMNVVIPPDIMDLDSADSLTTKENGDLQLRCRTTGDPKPIVFWRREDGRNITLRNEHQGIRRSTLLYSL